MEQDTIRQRTSNAFGWLFYGTTYWCGVAVLIFCAWNVLADVANGIRDWWHGGDREFVSLWWFAGLAVGAFMSAWGESGLQDIRAASAERHSAKQKELSDARRKQLEENRRYDRAKFADSRARERVANRDNPAWKERRIPEVLWEGCKSRNERLREWGFLLGEGWDNFDYGDEAE